VLRDQIGVGRTKKTDRIIQDQEGRADYGKFSNITIATSVFTNKNNQEDKQDKTRPIEKRQEK
jgi:hypothetical protein